jgi:periplasmic glucans biosynthesis protein
VSHRRTFLKLSSAFLALSTKSNLLLAQEGGGIRLGQPATFSFDGLIARARQAAAAAYTPVAMPPADLLNAIDYEALGKIHFNTDFALFRDGPGRFPATLFVLGKFQRAPVHIYALEKQDTRTIAREVLYEAAYFDMPPDSPARKLSPQAGFAGFRFQESRLGDQKALDWRKNDWVVFLGASYFRAIGELYQYGLSARGIAINSAEPDVAEEFPAFTQFYLEPGEGSGDNVTVYALLDGPSVAAAYRFVMARNKAVVMDVEAHIFLRRDVERLGLAPLTSMFWFSETEKQTAIDWRPEVHDSDGLAMWTGKGERIWRPLNDPPATIASAFQDVQPRGFGLMQRDRNFDHYLDGVHYERRPSLWVEPLDNWGQGAIQLIEIPTNDEIDDNTVVCWVPKDPAKAGNSYQLRYRLHWTAKEPFPSNLATCVATRLGRGGQPGQPRPAGVVKFVVEFLGGPLASLSFGVMPKAVLSSSRGRFSYVFTEAVPDDVPGHWRAQFDFTVDGTEPVEMRLYLTAQDKTLTETWLYQYHPR